MIAVTNSICELPMEQTDVRNLQPLHFPDVGNEVDTILTEGKLIDVWEERVSSYVFIKVIVVEDGIFLVEVNRFLIFCKIFVPLATSTG